ncbi:MAG TPA: NADPH-dependent assimilatory sulfite reductase hemoprotein subunit [Myxococcota bacterium]|nr:NADPH-dependent assimilatory sulfite reductase hemoprotein subunit [Myxococcota bacterium]
MAPQHTGPAGEATSLANSDLSRMSKNERIKAESKGLFFVSDGKGNVHPFLDEIRLLTSGERPTISGEAKELSKFFGIYKQQGRGARGSKTDDYFFMCRIKNPAGGELTPAQWLALDDAADLFADGTLRVTSRQGLQYHHVYGPKLANLVRHLSRHYRRDGTLSACGDVNRNVMTSPIDGLEPRHDVRGAELGHAIAKELAPRSSSYFQVWLTDEYGQTVAPINFDEPVYGSQYLPRKFKVGIAHPEDNSIDVLTQDVGFVPIVSHGRSDGSQFDFYSGGGLGLTHNNPTTAALLGLYLGRIPRAQVVEATRVIAILQKEHGERKDRRMARWKYTIRRLGVEVVKDELRVRFGLALEDAAPQPLPKMNLHLGWHAQRDGRGYYGISVENGRMHPPLRKAVRAAVSELGLGVRLTAQQDVLLCNVADRAALERILDAHGVPRPEAISLVRRNAMACPAKPTCGLAMTEAENILPRYIDAIENAGYGDVDAVIRMTGCPNNCTRPVTAEIGIYGYGKNDHVILVGGAREGSRLAKVLYERIPEEKMVPALLGLFAAIRAHARAGEPVGEFLQRADPAELRARIGLEGVVS